MNLKAGCPCGQKSPWHIDLLSCLNSLPPLLCRMRWIPPLTLYTTVRSDSYCSRSGLFFTNAREILLFASIALTYNGTAANKRTLHACALTHDGELKAVLSIKLRT